MLDDSILLHFDVHANEFGNLVLLQKNDNIPFPLKLRLLVEEQNYPQ